jgi:hypothetical protein
MKNKGDTMFKKDMIIHFYDPNYISNDDVMDAWFKYVYLFLPIVSKQWKDCVSANKIKNQQIIFQYNTVSDEALVLWFIEILMPKLELKEQLHWPEEERSNGIGKHDIKNKRNEYAIIHNKLEIARNDIKNVLLWNEKFWEMLSERKSDLFEDKKNDRPNRSAYKGMTIPLPGMNEEQDFSHFMNKTTLMESVYSIPDDVKSMNNEINGNIFVSQI